MKVDTEIQNLSLLRIMEDQSTVVFLDANFFIPPDRSNMKVKAIEFGWYKVKWLDPLFDSFPNLAIHETVYDELVQSNTKKYADEKKNNDPALLKVYYDADLTHYESRMLLTYINKLAVYSLYNPERDNAKDRGEVRSLSYMAVKRYLYFASNDDLPRRLIGGADKLQTGLDGMSFLCVYDVIYFLYKKDCYDNKALRILYKYLYHLTAYEKKTNPEWGVFIECMDALYLTTEE